MGFPGYLAPSPNTFDPSSIQSGTVGSGDLAFNTVYSGNVASGQIGWPHIANASIQSGSIASGIIFALHVASGGLGSGAIGSGQVGFGHLADGSVRSGTIGSGQVSTNHLTSGATVAASGSIQIFQLGSGAVNSGHVSSGAVLGQDGGGAFTVASGTLGKNDLSSGAIIRAAQYGTPFQSGTSWQLTAEEPISGVRAVLVSQSGRLLMAMASVSGRMPAIGIVVENVASGINANVYTHGAFQFSSGMTDFSGWLGKTVWVGRSGQVVQWSGGFNSGGFNVGSGGDFFQRLGTITGSGSIVANVQPDMQQNQVLPLNNTVLDALSRQFGV